MKMNNQTGIGKLYSSGWLWGLFAYSVAMLPVFLPLLLQVMEPKWDAIDGAMPAFAYITDAICAGRWPLWDPYTNCGYPFHADPGNSTLNPLVMLLGLLFEKRTLGFNWFWVLHWWWGGVGMMFLARRFGACSIGAFVAAISFVLSGFYVGHSQHTSFIMTAAWMPWVFACADKAVARGSLGYAVLAGVMLGFSTYGGYPGLILFACLAVGVWLLLRYMPESAAFREPNVSATGRFRRITAVLAIMAAFLVLIWLPTLHAFFVEGAGYTERVGALSPAEANNGDPFPLTAVVSFFFPYVSLLWRSWLGADISMTNGYVGILVLPLAVYWLRSKETGENKRWLWGFILIMFWLSLGGKFGLRWLMYYLYPPLQYIRFSSPFRLFWIMPLCLAGGLGLSRLIRCSEEWRTVQRLFLGWMGVTVLVSVIVWRVSQSRSLPVNGHFLQFAPPVVVLVLAVGILVALRQVSGNRFGGVAGGVMALLVMADMVSHLYVNAETVWRPRYNSNLLEAGYKRETTVNGSPVPRLAGMPYAYTNAQQVFKKPLVQGYMTMKSKSFDTVLCKSAFVGILTGWDRFWLSPGAESAVNREVTLQTLCELKTGDPVPAIVAKAPLGFPAERVKPGTFGTVTVKYYAPERVEMAVSVPGPLPAMLMSTERYTAGWRAYIDGAAADSQQVNLFFRGVYVPAGEHVVAWRYQPVHWAVLVTLSYLAVAGGLLAAGTLLWHERKRGC